MALTALPLQDKISQSSTADRAYRILLAQYGNGITDRAGDGANPIQDTWTLSYDSLGLSDYTSALAVFDATFGVALLSWTAPGDSASKAWRVTKLSRSALAGDVYSLSVTIIQEFDQTS